MFARPSRRATTAPIVTASGRSPASSGVRRSRAAAFLRSVRDARPAASRAASFLARVTDGRSGHGRGSGPRRFFFAGSAWRGAGPPPPSGGAEPRCFLLRFPTDGLPVERGAQRLRDRARVLGVADRADDDDPPRAG